MASAGALRTPVPQHSHTPEFRVHAGSSNSEIEGTFEHHERVAPPIPTGSVIKGHIEPYLLDEHFQDCLYGVIYRGVGLHTGDIVAAKLLIKEKIEEKERDRDLPETPLAEVFFAPHLHGHANIFTIREVCEVADYHFVVSDLAQAEDLLELLKFHSVGMPQDYVRYFMRQAAAALAFCHSRRVAMQDFSLENCLVFVDAAGEYKIRVCDPGQAIRFSVCPVTGEEQPVAYTGCVGKKFRPPEIFKKAPYYATKVDSWCLGWATFYLLFAVEIVESVWEGDNDIRWKYLRSNRFEELFQELHVTSRLTSEARDFILRLMHPDPELRMSATEALDHKFLNSSDIPAALNITQLSANFPGISLKGRDILRKFELPSEFVATNAEQRRTWEETARKKLALSPIIPDVYFTTYAELYCLNDKPSGTLLPFEFSFARGSTRRTPEKHGRGSTKNTRAAGNSRNHLAEPKLPKLANGRVNNGTTEPLSSGTLDKLPSATDALPFPATETLERKRSTTSLTPVSPATLGTLSKPLDSAPALRPTSEDVSETTSAIKHLISPPPLPKLDDTRYRANTTLEKTSPSPLAPPSSSMTELLPLSIRYERAASPTATTLKTRTPRHFQWLRPDVSTCPDLVSMTAVYAKRPSQQQQQQQPHITGSLHVMSRSALTATDTQSRPFIAASALLSPRRMRVVAADTSQLRPSSFSQVPSSKQVLDLNSSMNKSNFSRPIPSTSTVPSIVHSYAPPAWSRMSIFQSSAPRNNTTFTFHGPGPTSPVKRSALTVTLQDHHRAPPHSHYHIKSTNNAPPLASFTKEAHAHLQVTATSPARNAEKALPHTEQEESDPKVPKVKKNNPAFSKKTPLSPRLKGEEAAPSKPKSPHDRRSSTHKKNISRKLKSSKKDGVPSTTSEDVRSHVVALPSVPSQSTSATMTTVISGPTRSQVPASIAASTWRPSITLKSVYPPSTTTQINSAYTPIRGTEKPLAQPDVTTRSSTLCPQPSLSSPEWSPFAASNTSGQRRSSSSATELGGGTAGMKYEVKGILSVQQQRHRAPLNTPSPPSLPTYAPSTTAQYLTLPSRPSIMTVAGTPVHRPPNGSTRCSSLESGARGFPASASNAPTAPGAQPLSVTYTHGAPSGTTAEPFRPHPLTHAHPTSGAVGGTVLLQAASSAATTAGMPAAAPQRSVGASAVSFQCYPKRDERPGSAAAALPSEPLLASSVRGSILRPLDDHHALKKRVEKPKHHQGVVVSPEWKSHAPRLMT